MKNPISILSNILKIFYYIYDNLRDFYFRKCILSNSSIEEKFTWIYKNKYWGNHETVSGTGSTLEYTANLRKELFFILNDHSISSIFDAPCGDFNWMQKFLSVNNVNYIGGDIVRPLIDDLNISYKTSNTNFIYFDLTKNIPPYADLMICRDCLFHLSNKDIQKVLSNFILSKIPFLLTTTHKNSNQKIINLDIYSGDFRLLDLMAEPFNLPSVPLYEFDDWMPPEPERKMCLWSAEQIKSSIRDLH